MQKGYIEIVEPLNSFQTKVIKEAKRVLFKRSSVFIRGIEIDVRNYLGDVMKRTDIYEALTDGRLKAHFGFEKGTARQKVDAIIEKLQEEVVVTTTKDGIQIGIAEEGYEALFSLPQATVTTENGFTFNWLEWLLLRGTEPIISDYQIIFGNFTQSRSGEAIMISLAGKTWGVPAEYAGVEHDNWVTQTILETRESVVQQLEFIIRDNIKKVF